MADRVLGGCLVDSSHDGAPLRSALGAEASEAAPAPAPVREPKAVVQDLVKENRCVRSWVADGRSFVFLPDTCRLLVSSARRILAAWCHSAPQATSKG